MNGPGDSAPSAAPYAGGGGAGTKVYGDHYNHLFTIKGDKVYGDHYNELLTIEGPLPNSLIAILAYLAS